VGYTTGGSRSWQPLNVVTWAVAAARKLKVPPPEPFITVNVTSVGDRYDGEVRVGPQVWTICDDAPEYPNYRKLLPNPKMEVTMTAQPVGMNPQIWKRLAEMVVLDTRAGKYNGALDPIAMTILDPLKPAVFHPVRRPYDNITETVLMMPVRV
jgi:hypothetical protein